MALGNNVRVFREARRESLRGLAAAVAMDPGNLSKIERGLRGCADEDKLRLARHFGVPVGQLFFQETVVLKTTEGVAS